MLTFELNNTNKEYVDFKYRSIELWVQNGWFSSRNTCKQVCSSSTYNRSTDLCKLPIRRTYCKLHHSACSYMEVVEGWCSSSLLRNNKYMDMLLFYQKISNVVKHLTTSIHLPEKNDISIAELFGCSKCISWNIRHL